MNDENLTNRDLTGATDLGSATGESGLRHLRDCDDLQVADGYPDIRGWEVRTRDGQKLGKVHDLVISVSEMRARYLDVDIEDRGHALLPIGTAQLDDENDVVHVAELGGVDADAYPRYLRDDGIDRDYEQSVRSRFVTGSGSAAGAAAGSGAAATSGTNTSGLEYDDQYYDDQRLYAGRRGSQRTDLRGDAGEEQRLTLSEEQLAVGKREVQAGEVELRKHVETEHVRESIPLAHDEVTVERRSLEGVELDASTRIGEDQEIRVPLTREEAVVQKQAVAREEIIVRKRMVTENRTVEADLRRERLDIDDQSGVTRNNDFDQRT